MQSAAKKACGSWPFVMRSYEQSVEGLLEPDPPGAVDELACAAEDAGVHHALWREAARPVPHDAPGSAEKKL